MKNSNLLQALMAGGIAIGIALGGAGLGIALGKKDKDSSDTASTTSSTNTNTNTNSDSLLRLAKIMQLGTTTSYYNGIPAENSATDTAKAASKFFTDYLKTFNANFNDKKELVIAANAAANDNDLKVASLFNKGEGEDQTKSFMADNMFLILTSKTTSLDLKQSFLDNALTATETKLLHAVVKNYGAKSSFKTKLTLTITAGKDTTNGLAQDLNAVKWTITRDWAKTGDVEKYDISSGTASKVVLDADGFTALKAKFGLAAGEVHANWKIVATKVGTGVTANANGGDATTAVGVNKKTGQVAYYIKSKALAGATGATKLVINTETPA